MSRIKKIRTFSLKEIIVISVVKILRIFSINLSYSADLKQYSRSISKLIYQGFEVIRRNDKTLEISSNGNRFLIRRYGSDMMVFEQIVIGDEYNHVLSLINSAGLVDSELTVVDCGSNVGLFSAWIINRARVQKIISIEADKENYSFNKYFISKMKYENKIKLLNRAIWSNSSSVLGVSNQFRDGLQWAKSVVPPLDFGQETVCSISLNQILDDFIDQQVDVLKIDIEGSEKVVFENLDSCDRMLKNTKIIALEIHKEMDSTGRILETLQDYGFILEQIGEIMFGYKK